MFSMLPVMEKLGHTYIHTQKTYILMLGMKLLRHIKVSIHTEKEKARKQSNGAQAKLGKPN